MRARLAVNGSREAMMSLTVELRLNDCPMVPSSRVAT